MWSPAGNAEGPRSAPSRLRSRLGHFDAKKPQKLIAIGRGEAKKTTVEGLIRTKLYSTVFAPMRSSRKISIIALVSKVRNQRIRKPAANQSIRRKIIRGVLAVKSLRGAR